MALTPAEPPFTRKRTGPHYVWSSDLMIAHAFAAENGLTLFLSDAPNQVAKLIGDQVKLVIYPHKTTRVIPDHYAGWSAEEIALNEAVIADGRRMAEPIVFGGLSAPAVTGFGIESTINAVNRAYARGLALNLGGR